MCRFNGHLLKGQQIVRRLRQTGHVRSTLEAHDQQVENEPVILNDERSELSTTNHSVGVDVLHVFLVENDVVLRGLMIDDQTKQTIEQRSIDFFVEFFKISFQHHVALAFAGAPNLLEVVDALTPFVEQQRWWFAVRWFFYPGGK